MRSRLPIVPLAPRVPPHPGLRPYAELYARLANDPRGWIDAATAIAEAGRLQSAGGAPLHFVPVDAVPDAVDYETAIHDAGRVGCRRDGRGAFHDLHNALVWLRFPKTKAVMNRWHRRTATIAGSSAPVGRGRVRDAITLLDESGLVWFGGDPALAALLSDRDWVRLLVGERDGRLRAVRPVVIGHGLLEKLHRPYKAMTAHCLPLPAAADLVADDVADVDGVADVDVDVDVAVAARLEQLALAGKLVAARWLPLPVQGLPGWDPANADPSYYADRRVFRPKEGTDAARLHCG